jgi:hypothetical protein
VFPVNFEFVFVFGIFFSGGVFGSNIAIGLIGRSFAFYLIF